MLSFNLISVGTRCTLHMLLIRFLGSQKFSINIIRSFCIHIKMIWNLLLMIGYWLLDLIKKLSGVTWDTFTCTFDASKDVDLGFVRDKGRE